MQSAFHHNRDMLAAHGVHYAGRFSQPRTAAEAVATGKLVYGHRSGTEQWPRLVEEVNSSTAKRIVISSETFARCSDAAAGKVIAAFGADRTHVVMTMRPLPDLLPSAWQQFVKNGSRLSYEAWLRALFDPPKSGAKTRASWESIEFWHKTRIDRLARRWGALVGFDQVIVVSLADQLRNFVLRTFERFVGLPEASLVPDPSDSNVSLDFAVTEMIRKCNEYFYAQATASRDIHARLIEFGGVKFLRQAAIDGPHDTITVPRWAAQGAIAVAEEMNEGLRALGVEVVGDLDGLTRPTRPLADSATAPDTVDTALAAGLLYGALEATEQEIARTLVRAKRAEAIDNIDTLPTRTLVAVTANRVRQRVLRRIISGRRLT